MNPMTHRERRRRALKLLPVAAASTLLGGCLGGDGDREEINTMPGFVVASSVTAKSYDGDVDDLLTAGVGASGLCTGAGCLNSQAPTYANPAAPTAAELRRAAILTNYRAIVDTTLAGGYGSLYGPQVGDNGSTRPNDGKVAGVEVLAYSDDGTGKHNVTLMVQVPASFDRNNPCILTATSSGSRGVYGAISIGEWGLKRGCAVAYTDKGTGTAAHDLQADTVALIDGTRASAAVAGKAAQFNAGLTDAERASFNATTPNRIAFKHAHSQQNPEKDWGKYTLQAVEFAFWVLNDRLGAESADGTKKLRTFRPENTVVIASSLSNGGGAAIAAAELDTQGLIDGVAVSEPVVELPATLNVGVRRGATPQVIGKHLYDHVTLANLYQACAMLAPAAAAAPFRPNTATAAGAATIAIATNRCASLAERGLVTGATTEEQSADAMNRLFAAGWDPETLEVHAIQAVSNVGPAVAVTYANAYSRSSVKDRLCGFGFGQTVAATGEPAAVDAALLAQGFASYNGVPPSGHISLINENDPAGPRRDQISASPSTGRMDWNFDGALCLRGLLTHSGVQGVALRQGLDETRRSGNLRGKPAIIVQGRSDALIPPNHHARPYTALNKQSEGATSQLSYIEVTHAHHFDAFNSLPGFDARFVPLHVYLNRATDAVWARLKNGAALPPSQVVRATPRGVVDGSVPPLAASHVPPIAATPASGNAITMSGNTLVIPD